MKKRGIAIPGFDVKDGKVKQKPKRLSVSKRIQQRTSKRVRPARCGT